MFTSASFCSTTTRHGSILPRIAGLLLLFVSTAAIASDGEATGAELKEFSFGPSASAFSPTPALSQRIDARPTPIVNGVLEHGWPSVGLFLNGLSSCTGTLIGCRTFLTAAHCICTESDGTTLSGTACQNRPDLLDPTTKLLFFQHAGFVGVSDVKINPNFIMGSGSDLAILRLSESISGIRASRVNQSRRPPHGSEGVIVGFGTTSGAADDGGLKRSGQVQTAPCPVAIANSHICWNFEAPIGDPGIDSNTCQGDSGGPLFVELEGGVRVAGVTSFGNASCLAPDNAKDADVFVDRSWIQSAAGADLHRTDCGSLPFAGEAGTMIVFGADSLTPSAQEKRFNFEVPPGTAKLRFTLNAEAPLANDFDLYLRRGSPPTTSTFTCKSDFSVGLEYCDITNPQAGTWHGLVKRFSGAGVFQVTGTLFQDGGGGGGGGGGGTSPCTEDEFTVCAVSGRFEITTSSPRSLFPALAGRVSPILNADLGGAFHFFLAEENFHIIIKVSKRPSGFFAVSFFGGEPIEWDVRVRDTLTGQVKTYSKPFGTLTLEVDSQGFPVDP